MSDRVVIVGAGHAAGQVVATLKQKRFGGTICLIGEGEIQTDGGVPDLCFTLSRIGYLDLAPLENFRPAELINTYRIGFHYLSALSCRR